MSLRFTARPQILAPIAVLFVLVGLLGGCGESAGESQPVTQAQNLRELFCVSKQARRQGVVADTTTPVPNTKGLNKRNYHVSREYGDTKSLDELGFDNLDAFREESFQKQLRSFLTEARVAWDARGLDTLAAKHDVYENLLRQVGGLARFVNVVDHRGEVDCRANVYRYRVSFWILKEPLRAVNEEAYRVFETHSRRIVSDRIDAAGQNPNQIVINTDIDLIQPLLADAELRRQLRNTLRPEDFALLHDYAPETWHFLQSLVGNTDSVFPFRSGKYQLTGEMAYAVDIAVRGLLQRRTRGDRYQIISRGYADAQPITALIQYGSRGRLTLGPNAVAPLSDTSQAGGLIRSNQELSVARGFAGAEGIAATLKTEVASDEERKTIQVLYSGGGAVSGPVHERNRRIDIIMLRVEPKEDQ